MRCKEVVERTTDSLEGALSNAERSEWQSHVAGCIDCARYVAQMYLTVRLLAELPAAEFTKPS